jgi:ATP-binding cassette subfamily B protein
VREPALEHMVEKREFTVANAYRYDRSSSARWIVSHMLRYPQFPLAALLASILNNWFYSSIQVFVGRAFDVIITPGWAAAALLSVALSVAGAGIIQGLTGLLRNYSMEFLAQHVERDAREELYISLLGKSQTFHGRQRVGDIMARATDDVHWLNLMFSPGVMLIMDSLLGTVMPVALIARLNPRLLLVPSIFLVFLAITIADYNRRLKPVTIAMRDQFGQMDAGLAEAIAGIEVVKANVQERYERNKFAKDARLFRDYFVKEGEIEARYLPMLVYNIASAAGLLHALWLWRGNVITLGQVIAFVGLMRALNFVTFISIFSFNLVQLGMASGERVLELINTETELDENKAGASQPIRGQVTFENVSFSYDGQPVLKDINFMAQPGETVAIVGETGSGKTTLTRLINRIFDANGGRVLVDGVDVRDWSLEALRSQISSIEQDIFLFSRSVRDNIAFGRADATQKEIESAAHEAQADEFIARLPNGYDTELGERGAILSGGERQRIAIARAFLTNPRILILDDSTSAIDSATEDLIQRAMRRISRQRTTFLITHRLSQIRWADRILVLRRGELVDQGTHDELMVRCEAYRRIFARYE